MIKRIIATILCLVMAASVFASCTAKRDEDYKGATINMYISEEIYNFDPAYAFKNDSALKIVNLLFSTLFTVNENGKVEKALAKNYVIDENKNAMIITIRDDAFWSDGTYVSANDVTYTIKRLLDPEFTSEAACLLYDIKNARTVKNAKSDLYIDDIGVYPVGEREVEITFEDGFKNYDQFIENLASPALAPLREDIVAANEDDWAKKPGTMACSGPFMIRKVSYSDVDKGITLERNPYYQRKDKDMAVDKKVKPYRIVIDYTKSVAEQYEMFKRGEIFYVGDFAIDARSGLAGSVELSDAMSTASIYLNQNAYIANLGAYKNEQTNLSKKEKEKLSTYVIDKVKEDEETGINELGIKTVTLTETSYVTYYNHMSAEDYAALYPNTEYVHTKTNEKTLSKDYSFYKSYSTTEVKVEDGETVYYVTKYDEYRYTGPNSNTPGEDKKYEVDTPYGVKLFADKNVREALSLVIDREALANKIVYAKAATALVPYGVFNDSRKNSFREEGKSYIATSANANKAAELLEKSNINASDYEILLTVQESNLEHVVMAEEIQLAWESLGFKVKLEKISPEVNDEIGSTGEVAKDILDNVFDEALYNRTYQAAIVDVVASTTRAYSILAPFATEFAGTAMDFNAKDGEGNHLYAIEGHITGYNNKDYNKKIDEAFAEKDETKRAAILHAAEEILLADMPVIPLVFNQDAYIVSDEIKGVESSFFGTRIFTTTGFKDKERLS